MSVCVVEPTGDADGDDAWPPTTVAHSFVPHANRIISLGGFSNMNTHVDSYLSSTELWQLDTQRMAWSKLVTSHEGGPSGGPPPKHASAACCVLHDRLYLLCGMLGKTHRSDYNTCVFSLDLRTLVWTKVFDPTDKDVLYPSGRDKLSSFVYRDAIYLFGGYGAYPSSPNHLFENLSQDQDRLQDLTPERVWHDSLIRFDPEVSEFSLVRTVGDKPPPRAACALCRLGGRVFVFGGRLHRVRVNDLYCLHLGSMTWRRILPKGVQASWPHGRSWAVLSATHSGEHCHTLVMYGGLDSDHNNLSDIWIFDTRTEIWTRVFQNFNRCLFWHAGALVGGRVFMFGGFRHPYVDHTAEAEEVPTSQLLVFRLAPSSLQTCALTALGLALSSREEEETVTDYCTSHSGHEGALTDYCTRLGLFPHHRQALKALWGITTNRSVTAYGAHAPHALFPL